jgi:hypothetical protein
MAKNMKGKTRPQSDPYETFIAPGFEWKVLKHYQSTDAEATNPYARVFCATKGPGTYGSYELGDGYLHEILAHGLQVQGDPLRIRALSVPV